MAKHTVEAEPRHEFGNGPSRRLRAQGRVPGVMYQPAGDALPISVNERELRRVLFSSDGRTSVIELSIGGGPAQPAVLTDWQLDHIRGNIRHVDFRPAGAEEVASGVVVRAPEHIEVFVDEKARRAAAVVTPVAAVAADDDAGDDDVAQAPVAEVDDALQADEAPAGDDAGEDESE